VAIVNERYVRTFFPDGNAIGRTFGKRESEGKPDRAYRIVGVVGDTKYGDLREDFVPIIYAAYYQMPDPGTDSTFVVRASEAPASVIASLKRTAAESSPEIVLNFSVFRRSVLEGLTRERLMATLSGFYGVLAALLAMVGIYGIISYMVVRRRNEIGVRIALGAGKTNILGMVLRETLTLLAIGVIAGTALAIGAGKAAQVMLFGLKATDLPTLVLAAGSLTLIAVAASVLPAARAAGVDPMQVLREE
jgi:ABC-type antimicrobial peptide transport system permease subunit